jgi:predicted enzyme related to lactoylglutathione lyase
MPEISEYAPGTPSWVDLASPDPDASARFYGGLFGWSATDPGPVEETGGYRMLQHDGRDVAGLGPTQAGGEPAMWTTYVSTDDADAVAAKVREAGGRVVMDALDVLGAGRMAVFADAGGAVISVWQPLSHHGAAVVNEPGSLCWNELATRDIDEAKRFYAAVFGWRGDTNAFGDSSYTEWKLDGRTIGGMIQMNDEWPAEVPAHWMVYFAVEDIDAATAKVEELGGRISVPPTDTPAGRFSVVNDPHGAVFSIIRLAEGRDDGEADGAAREDADADADADADERDADGTATEDEKSAADKTGAGDDTSDADETADRPPS